jgi:hypothetical protein
MFNYHDVKWMENHLFVRYTNMERKNLRELLRNAEKNETISKEAYTKLMKDHEDALARLKKFDKTTYDRTIFKEADELYRVSSGYDKHYGRCLLTILKNRGIAKGNYEPTTEFLNWSNAYKKHRSANNKLVKSSSPNQ